MKTVFVLIVAVLATLYAIAVGLRVTVDAIRTGRLEVRDGSIERHQRPFWFWFGVAVWIALASLMTISTVAITSSVMDVIED